MKKPNVMAVILFLTGMLCVVLLLFLNRTLYQHTVSAEKDLEPVMEQIIMKQNEIKDAENAYLQAVSKKEATLKYLKQKAFTSQQEITAEHVEVMDDQPAAPSVFSESDNEDLFSSDDGQ